ncbi:MAG: hypothetical protein JWQ76_687 [Ramlibacter sp.]|nr:hypothetical protein [Ramlibacter sp.]
MQAVFKAASGVFDQRHILPAAMALAINAVSPHLWNGTMTNS